MDENSHTHNTDTPNQKDPTIKVEIQNQPVKVEIQENKVRKIGLGLILGWLLGIFAFIWGVVNISRYSTLGTLSIISGIFIFPPIINFLKSKLKIELTGGLRWFIYIVLQAIGTFMGLIYILQGFKAH